MVSLVPLETVTHAHTLAHKHTHTDFALKLKSKSTTLTPILKILLALRSNNVILNSETKN